MTPEVTLPTNTATLADHAVTASAAPDGDRVAVSVVVDYLGYDPVNPDGSRDPRFVENVMFWVNGEFVVDSYQQQAGPVVAAGHAWTEMNVGRRKSIGLSLNRPAIASATTGPAVVTVSLFDSTPGAGGGPRGIVYLRLPVTLPPLSRPAVVPGRYLRCLFQTNPRDMAADERQAVKDAGANAFEVQIFVNPRGSGETFEQCQSMWHGTVGQSLQIAGDMGMLVVGCGDDFAKDANAYNWTRDTGWAADYIAWVSQRCKDAGNVVCLEVQDEVPATAIDDPVYQKIRDAWTSVPGHVPMGWPTLAIEDNRPLEAANWSDYVSRYVDPNAAPSPLTGVLVWRSGNPDGGYTGWQIAAASEQQAATIDHARPFMIDAGCSGPFYDELGGGPGYQPGVDRVWRVGMRPGETVLQCWVNACLGSTGVRLYRWDRDADQQQLPPPVEAVQIGARPGNPQWPGVVAALQSLAGHEAELLGPYHGRTTFGPWLVGRWDGLTAWCNTSEVARPAPAAGGLVTPGGELWVVAGDPVPALGVVLTAGGA